MNDPCVSRTLPALPAAGRWIATLLACAGLATALGARAQTDANACGPVATPGHYGPFDYRTQRAALAQVERAHFTPAVEAGLRGSSGDMGLDISYTLKSSPNHHRALMTIVRLGARTKSPQPANLEYSIECWFDRALRFQPNDTVARMVYAQYLGQVGRVADARKQLETTTRHAEDNPLTHYNIGLVAFELGDHAMALAQSHRARKLGFDGPKLVALLKQQNKWQEPAE